MLENSGSATVVARSARAAARHRVVVTGVGLVTPLGTDTKTTWEGLNSKRSGIESLTRFDASAFPIKIGGQVPDFDALPYVVDRKTLKVVMRDVLFSMAAAHNAIEDSKVATKDVDPGRFGLYSASNGSRLESTDLYSAITLARGENGAFDIGRFGREGLKTVFPLWLLKSLANNGLCHLSIQYNIQGANCNYVSSTGGLHAIGSGYRSIERGELDLALCIAYDSFINWEDILQYSRLGFLAKEREGILPEHVSRPFDMLRCGAVPSEGAGAILLESENHARQRGATPYAQVLGVGHSVNGNSLIAPPDDGRGIEQALRAALRSANVSPKDVDCISANGSSSPRMDRAEARAICSVMGRRTDDIPVTATKSMLGHMMAASGCVESAIAAKMIRESMIVPTKNYEYPDPDCPLIVVKNCLTSFPVDVIACLNSGIGGQNSALVLGRCH